MTNAARESGFYIGANESGTMFSAVVNYSYDSGGPDNNDLGLVRELLGQPDALGEKADVVVFAKEGVDGIRVVGPDVVSIRIAIEKLLEVGKKRGSSAIPVFVNRI